MKTIADSVRQTRRALGLSQVDLSHLSGVSLPTIQNIEAGRANPSLSTLRSLLGPLGFAVECRRRATDWATLAVCGLPLVSTEVPTVRPGRELLVEHLRRAIIELSEAHPGGQARSARRFVERERQTVQALLLALKVHFPSIYKKHFRKSPLAQKLVSGKPTGRVAKLKRMAERALAEYL